MGVICCSKSTIRDTQDIVQPRILEINPSFHLTLPPIRRNLFISEASESTILDQTSPNRPEVRRADLHGRDWLHLRGRAIAHREISRCLLRYGHQDGAL